ncbi:hypothetical protein HKX48_003085 [Thoreauomyces humboldtii]|nr:hypothetical protein HKX48_003085 [Thoreauomyces humboldtii]
MWKPSGSFLCAISLLAHCIAVHAESPATLDPDNARTRYDYRQVFKKPFFMYEETKIPYFEEIGHTILTPDYVRLTASVPDNSGAIWTKAPNPHKEWQVEFSFSVYGRGYMGGEGLAFWYTKDKMPIGPMYGSGDKWNGLAVVFDTGDQQENRYTPYIYGQMNTGSEEMAHRRDYLTTSMAGCFRDYRNTPAPVWARITYANQTLRVDIDIRQHGEAYLECFTHKGIDLPSGYHFGLSAATEAHLSDDHDIMTFAVSELNPQPPKQHIERPREAEHVKKEGEFHINEDVRALIQRIEHKVDQAREQAVQREDPSFLDQALDPHAIEKLEGNQFHIIEALNIIQQQLGESKTPHDYTAKDNEKNSGSRDVDSKLDVIITRLGVLSNDIKGLSDHTSKTSDTLSQLQAKKAGRDQVAPAQGQAASGSTSSHLTAGAVGFALGGFSAWIVSLLRRVGEEKTKKFY